MGIFAGGKIRTDTGWSYRCQKGIKCQASSAVADISDLDALFPGQVGRPRWLRGCQCAQQVDCQERILLPTVEWSYFNNRRSIGIDRPA